MELLIEEIPEPETSVLEPAEEVQFDILTDPLADQLSKTILDEYRCISIKINFAPGEYDASSNSNIPEELYSVQGYLRDSGVDIIYSSCGLHLNGENKRPHIHYHIIAKSLPTGTFQSNNSQHRKRWLAKEGNEYSTFEHTSIRFPKKENPVWCHLAYPYKENLPIKRGEKNIAKYRQFLIGYAVNLYQISLGNRAKQDASDERKKVALLSLAKLLEDNKSEFTNYREMVIWLDTNYISKLSLEEMPDPKNYKTNCQKICVYLGKLKYSDIL